MLKVLFLILILMSSTALAQTKTVQKDVPKAYIFTELGKANNAEVKKKFEEFYKKLKDSVWQGYIINYGTTKEIVNREKQLMNTISFHINHVVRLTVLRSKNIGKLKTVFWIVPVGADPPSTISQIKNRI